MKITLVASIQFSNEMIQLRQKLEEMGHSVEIPLSTEKIAKGDLLLDEYMTEKEAHGDAKFRADGPDAIKDHYKKIISSDAILVANYTKKNVANYIGGNTLMEMGFAYVNDKKIFLLNDIPDMPYIDEIQAMNPTLLKNDINNIN